MRGKPSTDEHSQSRGCDLVSLCLVCQSHPGYTQHLLFEFIVTSRLWSWLSKTINQDLHFDSSDDIWLLCSNHISPYCTLTLKASFIFLINFVRIASNSITFHFKVGILIPSSRLSWLRSNSQPIILKLLS